MMKFRMDTHMHFDLYNNRNEVLDYIENNHSYTIAVTNLPDLFERSLHLCEKRRFSQIALGFHPELAFQYSNQILKFDRYISATKYIGEIGLDFTTIIEVYRITFFLTLCILVMKRAEKY